jgi:hypothetical protein
VPSLDGNRNVWRLVQWSDRSVAAQYEYGPYGGRLRAVGRGLPAPVAGGQGFKPSPPTAFRTRDWLIGEGGGEQVVGKRGSMGNRGLHSLLSLY